MILMYHKVGLESPTMWWVNADAFYRQMFELQNKTVVYLDDYDPNNSQHVVITFDGVYKNVLSYAAPIMHKFGYPYELFITSDYLGGDNKFDTVEPKAEFASVEELQKLESLGGRVQWHTQSHPDLKNVSDKKIIAHELTIPDGLKVFGGDSLQWFAYPYGNLNETVVDEVKQRFKGAVSCNQGSDNDCYKFNRVTVTNESRFTDKKVTCIIPCYNYGSFISEAIESVLRQTILPDEIIIADDCSTDMTQEIAMFFQKKHPKLISYFKNEKNLGIVPNFNKAISLSTGDYIVFLGADNRFQSNYIEECAAILNKHNDTGIAYTDFLFFGSRAKKMYLDSKREYQSTIANDYYKIEFPEVDDIDVYETLKKQNFVHGSSMFSRESFEKVGGYKAGTDVPEDYNLFLRIVKSGYKIKKAASTVLQYRQHSLDQANHVFGTQALVNIYTIKIRELEAELRFLRNSRIISAVSFAFKVKNNAKRFVSYLKKNGLNKTIGRVLKK